MSNVGLGFPREWIKGAAGEEIGLVRTGGEHFFGRPARGEAFEPRGDGVGNDGDVSKTGGEGVRGGDVGAFVDVVASDENERDVGRGTRRGEGLGEGVSAQRDVRRRCLLYTSPSPRDS